MNEHNNYTKEDIKNSYKHVNDLLVTKYIIKKYSTNTIDIRKRAIGGLVLSDVKKVLDLGCGYGFFIEILKNKLNKNATITGIDLVENNKDAYLNTIGSIGYKGEFINDDVNIIKDFNEASYDLVIASYSLYFFPHLIKSIARLLDKNGVFITITHSHDSLKELISLVLQSMKDIGIIPPQSIRLQLLLRMFSLENGTQLLNKYFNQIDLITYDNSMQFSVDNIDDCIYYIEKKKQLMFREVLDNYPDRILDLEETIIKQIYKKIKKSNSIKITKDDAIFRCFGPMRT